MPPFSRAPRTQPETISVSAPTLAASAPEDQTRREADAKPSSNPPPLDLRLPASPRSPGIGGPATPARLAIEAQVGRYAIRTPEARMAHRLAAEWTVENLGDGRVRMRRGDDCIMLNETQASQLDPWNNRGTAPRGAGPCAP